MDPQQLPPSDGILTEDTTERDAVELQQADPSLGWPREQIVNPRKFGTVRRFWHRHVQMSVPHIACRDHLANERTYLGYLRTSQTLAMLGVLISQFYRIEHTTNPSTILGFYIVGVPMASICHCLAIIIAVIGCWRYINWQNEMVKGNSLSGGWEVMTIFVLVGLVLLAQLLVVIVIDILKTDTSIG